ncbi:MAG: 16S rRNA (cytidine(1402)-2'-O)-methyltransferase [Pseudomonadota bacterium]
MSDAGDLDLKPGLYVTATPIGNLGDITYRAVAALRGADLILCEDTRRTAKLCNAYGIKTRREAYHEHNAERMRPEILQRLQDGARICLVSDAGTPLISDPGFKLVSQARGANITVTPIPGPSALTAALSASGAPPDHFYFGGFAPSKAKARRDTFAALSDLRATLAFFETPSRLRDCLCDLIDALGDREACIARELTKIHEAFSVGKLSELLRNLNEKELRGEIVLLVYPPEIREVSDEMIVALVSELLKTMSVRNAAAQTASQLGVARKRAYAIALALADEK